MYSREEASKARQAFWTAFGKYLRPVPNAEGIKINWINYHTGVKDLYFRMNADAKLARVSISIEHEDAGIRELFFDQLRELKPMLDNELEEEWQWRENIVIANRSVSIVHKDLSGFSIFKEADWPELISFFKPRIIALDRFWETAKYVFEELK